MDLLKFSFQWFIFRFLRLFTSKFIHENKFRFKSEFKRQAHICKFAVPWAKNNPETTRRFRKYFCWSLNLRYKNCFHPVSSSAMIALGSCEASFHSEAVVHIYAKPIHCNAKIKRCQCRTQVFENVFGIHLLHLGFSLVSLRLFLLKQRKNNSRNTRCSRRANFTASREIHRFLAS